MEQLIGFIIFAIIAGIGQWLQKRAERGTENSDSGWEPQPPPQSPPALPPRRGRTIRWEDELSKHQHETNRPLLKPIILETVRVPDVRPISRPPALPVETSEGDLVFRSPLHTAEETHAKGGHLQAEIAARMAKLHKGDVLHPPKLAPKARPAKTAEIQRALNLTKSAAGMRQAFIASQVFGPPKSLQS